MATNPSEVELDAHPSSFSSNRQFVSSLISQLALALAPDRSLNPLTSTNQSVKNILLTLHALFPEELLPALDVLDRRLVLRCSLEAHHNEAQDEASKPSQDGSEHVGLDDSNNEGISRSHVIVDMIEAKGTLPTVLVDQNTPQEYNTFVQEQLGQTNELSARNDNIAKGVNLQTNATTSEHVVQRRSEPSEMERHETESSEHVVQRDIRPTRSVYYVRSGRQISNTRSKWRDATAESTAHYEVRLLAWNCSCPAFAFSAISTTTQHATVSHDDANVWQLGGKSLGDGLPMCKHILACVLIDQCPQFTRFVEEMNIDAEAIVGWAAGYGD